MTLIALASAKGSPGVSTAALALAAVWSSDKAVVLAEADPAGSALAPRFGLPYDHGVASLAPAARRHFSATDLAGHTHPLPIGLGRDGILTLVGVRGPEQSRVLGRFWSAFALAMGTVDGTDVLADCGRLIPDSPAMPIVTRAHMTLLLVRPDVENVVQGQLRASALREAGVEPERLAVIVVGDRPYGQAAVAEALDVPLIATLAYDPRMAGVLSGQHPGRRLRMRRSPLMRSARTLCDRLDELVLPIPASSPSGWDIDAEPGVIAAGILSQGSDARE